VTGGSEHGFNFRKPLVLARGYRNPFEEAVVVKIKGKTPEAKPKGTAFFVSEMDSLRSPTSARRFEASESVVQGGRPLHPREKHKVVVN